MTILELLEWGNRKLKDHRDIDAFTGDKLDSPMLDAEILLSHVLDESKSYLFTHLNEDVPEKQAALYQRMIKRRVKHEPVATIIGKKEFFKREFTVNRFVLTPRPETEVLIENAIDHANKLAGKDAGDTWFADIGTGSGAIAITLAAETKTPVVATDISAEALAVARQNAEEHKVTDLVDFKTGDTLVPIVKLFKQLKKIKQPLPDNLILCANLPYLTTEQWEKAQPEVRDWEPKQALEAGSDGLDVYWILFKQLAQHRTLLPKNLFVLIEIDPSQTAAANKLIRHHFPEAELETKKDLAGLDRVLITQLS
mgnify:CR=1 FL=1